MQELIEEVIRGIGYLALKLVTWGRYAGGGAGDRLREGALGLVLVAVGLYVLYSFGSA
jgi:hypothetical protein